MRHAFLPNAITYVNLMQMLCNEYENKTYELHKKIQPCHRMIKQNQKKETKSKQVNSVFIFCCCVWLFNDVGGGGIVVVCCDAIYLVWARIRRLPLMSFFFFSAEHTLGCLFVALGYIRFYLRVKYVR